jgi:hypothetical protein
MVKCRRVTIKKHGSKSFTVNLGGKAMYEVGTKEHGKQIARGLKVTEAHRCGKKVSKKEAKYAKEYLEIF